VTPIALLHVTSGVLALVAGALVLARSKGDRSHRLLGRIYFAGMSVLNLTGLGIYRLFDGFGPFHAAALISLATIVPGVHTARAKRPGWLVAREAQQFVRELPTRLPRRATTTG
jgi:uncharacterized membrane protein